MDTLVAALYMGAATPTITTWWVIEALSYLLPLSPLALWGLVAWKRGAS